jgi:hypothetical protein
VEATVSTGVRIPGSEPAADPDDRQTGRQSQRILRTLLRTICEPRQGALVKEVWKRPSSIDDNQGQRETCVMPPAAG